MVDINIVKIGNKTYSIKTSLDVDETNKDAIIVKILNVDLVEQLSETSIRKLKNVFQSDGTTIFSKLKYKDIYAAITKKLAQKYRMKILKI